MYVSDSYGSTSTSLENNVSIVLVLYMVIKKEMPYIIGHIVHFISHSAHH